MWLAFIPTRVQHCLMLEKTNRSQDAETLGRHFKGAGSPSTPVILAVTRFLGVEKNGTCGSFPFVRVRPNLCAKDSAREPSPPLAFR